ncbi:MAG: hypothetical protein VYC39_04220 [Myxococcota bacterium]|nr:hypothetical protein [Myxococcota bacterium]
MNEKELEITEVEKNFIGTVAKVYSAPQVTRADSAKLIQDIERRYEFERRRFSLLPKLVGVVTVTALCIALVLGKSVPQGDMNSDKESELIWSVLMLDSEDFVANFPDELDEEEFDEYVDELPEEYAALTMLIDADVLEPSEFVE